ncbi:hypothetical protein TNCV_2416951 [Trichonephila clavipes]|nr:hypothetical protein TNCV_2416951 [Trichonephila clavipes]
MSPLQTQPSKDYNLSEKFKGCGGRFGPVEPAPPCVPHRHWVNHNTLKKLEVALTLEKSAHPFSRNNSSAVGESRNINPRSVAPGFEPPTQQKKRLIPNLRPSPLDSFGYQHRFERKRFEFK